MFVWSQTWRALGPICAYHMLPPGPSLLDVFSVVTGHILCIALSVPMLFTLPLSLSQLAFNWHFSHKLFPNSSRAF